MPTPTKYKCTSCDKEFIAGDWECFSGQSHTLESKTYYMADAPFLSKADLEKDPDGLSRRSSRNNVHCIPPQRMMNGTGQVETREYGPLIFAQGKFETAIAMEQYYLENSRITQALVSREAWLHNYSTPKQRMSLENGKMVERVRDLERKERELNDLLAKAQANVKAGKPASA
jgi:hypothetical protein